MPIHSLPSLEKEAEMTSKEGHDHDVLSSSSIPTLECCMCGDYGLSQQLFRCRVCFSRFQHRYCSNLYPRAGTYRVCNWCLNKGGSKIERSQSSSSLSVSYRNTAAEGEENKKRHKNNTSHVSSAMTMKVRQRGSTSSQLLANNKPIKKQAIHSDESIGRKKTAFRSQKSLRRTKSEVTVNSRMIKQQVFRGRVQRYKLLEEVFVQ